MYIHNYIHISLCQIKDVTLNILSSCNFQYSPQTCWMLACRRSVKLLERAPPLKWALGDKNPHVNVVSSILLLSYTLAVGGNTSSTFSKHQIKIRHRLYTSIYCMPVMRFLAKPCTKLEPLFPKYLAVNTHREYCTWKILALARWNDPNRLASSFIHCPAKNISKKCISVAPLPRWAKLPESPTHMFIRFFKSKFEAFRALQVPAPNPKSNNTTQRPISIKGKVHWWWESLDQRDRTGIHGFYRG